MKFFDLLPQVTDLLRREGRVSYRAIQLEFGVDEKFLEALRDELVFAKRQAVDEAGRVLVYTGGDSAPAAGSAAPSTARETLRSPTVALPPLSTRAAVETRSARDAERRQLTVMFCDLVGSTDLSCRLDPEDLREVVRAYQETAAAVIEGFQGHVAQYLGDGLLIYFGYPRAHEDDAARAVSAGLGIVDALATLNARLETGFDVRLMVRIGIHTGPVVVGDVGGGDRHEQLALGETPNIAARLERLARPDTVLISAATARLVKADFTLEDLGAHEIAGMADPIGVARVLARAEDAEAGTAERGFTDLVGRDAEIALLLRSWDKTRNGQGEGRVVLLSGEPGIGKSALINALRDHVRRAGFNAVTYRCSPYAQSSALQPVLQLTQRLLRWRREDTPEVKLEKLERALEPYQLAPEEIVPLVAPLFSLPLPEGRYPPLELTPRQQRRQTREAIAAWLLAEADRKPFLVVWEDLHWADPSTLELLELIVDQVPKVPALHVLAYRPEFELPWPIGAHMTPIAVERLERSQVEAVVEQLAGGKRLPAEVIEHVVRKTDGVPLYVEELTKILLDSDLLSDVGDAYVLAGPLSDVSIPSTLQDSLMARLDREPAMREVAQLGAVLGRRFVYEMLEALGVLRPGTLEKGLDRLVETELLHQRGRPPRSKYIFRHALIRDAAYASLLRRTRQQYHRQVAELLGERFPEVVETEPELVAYHYTEAGLDRQAMGLWQRAGQRASSQLANHEAISHFTTALALLEKLRETPERLQLELDLRLPLGTALVMTRGQAAEEVEATFSRAREICRRLGDTPELFPALFGLWRYYIMRPDLAMARDLGEQLLRLAKDGPPASSRVVAHYALGITHLMSGELTNARAHLQEGTALYPTQGGPALQHAGQDPGVACLVLLAWTSWLLGYPSHAQARGRDGLDLALEQADPFTLGYALNAFSVPCQLGHEIQKVEDQAEAAVSLSTQWGFGLWLAMATIMRGWAQLAQGRSEEGLDHLDQGLAGWRDSGAGMLVPYFLALRAEALGSVERVDEALEALGEAQLSIERTGERWFEAEVWRLRGSLLLARGDDPGEAEELFQRALGLARRQQARSLELRAATSLGRLWQRQGRRAQARELVSEIYGWFTEGLDSEDLRRAEALLAELEESAGSRDPAHDAAPAS